MFTLGYLLCIHLKFSERKRPTCLEIGLFLLCINYSPWKHTSKFIYSSWLLSMEHFPLTICNFQTTFLKTWIKATEVSILATSAGHLKYWHYGKMRELRVKSSGIFWHKIVSLNPTSCKRYISVRLYVLCDACQVIGCDS